MRIFSTNSTLLFNLILQRLYLYNYLISKLAFCGSYGGAVLGMPISGFLADQIGWFAPYYFYGCCGVIWYCFWLWLAFEKPSKHPCITPREQLYIEQSIAATAGKSEKQPTLFTTPWGKVFTSMPVWAIIVANFARSWTFYLLLITQPKYFKEVSKKLASMSAKYKSDVYFSWRVNLLDM